MRKILKSSGKGIRQLVDFFYPPFRRYMTPEFFRYGFTGAANVVFDLFLYFIVYNFVLQHHMVHLGFVTISSHVAALLIVFPITFMTGFLLQKYVTFTTSLRRGRTQLLRYGMVVALNLGINYGGLKLFVDAWGWYPTPSRVVIIAFATAVSYFFQKRFTFK